MFVILIAGPSASGKTGLATNLYTSLIESDPNIISIKMDDYFKEIPDGEEIEAFRANTDFDRPDMIDFGLLNQHIVDLNSGLTITKPIFDFETNRRLNTEQICPPSVLIIEGIFALHFVNPWLPEEIPSLKVFVETNSYRNLLERRVARDFSERNRSKDAVLKHDRRFCCFAFFSRISGTRSEADIIVDNSDEFGSAIVTEHPIKKGVAEIILALNEKRSVQPPPPGNP